MKKGDQEYNERISKLTSDMKYFKNQVETLTKQLEEIIKRKKLEEIIKRKKQIEDDLNVIYKKAEIAEAEFQKIDRELHELLIKTPNE